MACNKCKKKERIDFIESEIKKVEKPIIIFMIAVGMLALYGMTLIAIEVYSLF